MRTARSELMFDRLKERNGLMKSVLENLRKDYRYRSPKISILPFTTHHFVDLDSGDIL